MIKRVRRLLSKKEVDKLLKGWFVRDGKTFVKARASDSGWEKTLKKGAAYSSYILDSPTDKELFRKAYPLAKDTLTAMMLPVKTKLNVGNQEASYTDGTRIVVSTKVFEDADMTNGDKLDVFLGLTVHEGAHVKYTDFDVVRSNKNRVIHELGNILEDERIEMHVGEDTPGFARFLEKTKYYYFDKKFKKNIEKSGWDKMNDFEKIMAILLRLIRYPTELRYQDLRYLGDYLIRIKEVLVPYPHDTEHVHKAAVKIYEILKELVLESEKMPDALKKIFETDDADAEKELPKELPVIEITAEELAALDRELCTGGSADRIIAILKVIGADKLKPAEDEVASFIAKDPHLVEELEGEVERPNASTFIHKKRGSQTQYMNDLKVVKKYVPAIQRHLKGHSRGYKIIHRSMRSGYLDTNKIVEAVQGISTVYTQEGEVKTDSVNVVLLGDESGSMGGDSIDAARRTMILLKEALDGLPNVELFMYGHTADMHGSGVVDLHVYHEPGWKPKYGLGDVTAWSQNRDGDAILQTALRVRKHNNKPCLFFVMSDGAPCASGYSGKYGVQHTKQCVQKVQKMGFRVIQIAINHSFEPSTMFDHFLIMENMGTLARDLGRVVKKAVEQLTAIKVS